MKTFFLLSLFYGSVILSAAPAVFRNDAGPLEIRVYSGPQEEPLHGNFLSPVEWQGQDGLKIVLETQKNVNFSKAVLNFTLPGGVSRYALLTVEAVCSAGRPVAFYDGFASHDWDGKTSLERNTIQQTFPLAAAWDSRQGIALGLTPDSMVSDMHCGLRRIQSILALQVF